MFDGAGQGRIGLGSILAGAFLLFIFLSFFYYGIGIIYTPLFKILFFFSPLSIGWGGVLGLRYIFVFHSGVFCYLHGRGCTLIRSRMGTKSPLHGGWVRTIDGEVVNR